MKALQQDSVMQNVLAGGGDMGVLMRAFDWAASPVGPVETWPQSLRTALGILLASGYPMYIAWGESFTQFYNDAYRPILGATKHPMALGQSTPDCFAEIWDFIGPMFRRVLSEGEATTLVDQMMPLERYGYAEECYFTFSYSAIRDATSRAGGVFVTVIETTARLIGERRLRTLRELAARTGGARKVKAACSLSAEVLSANPNDLPFALIYLLDEEGKRARLSAMAGLPDGHLASPIEIVISDKDSGNGWPLGKAMPTGGVSVDDLKGRFGVLNAGPWPEPVETAVMIPIVLPGQEGPVGFMVAGVNPRRRIDDDYRNFYKLVAEQVATAISRARAYETERQRAEALAELDRAKTAFFNNVSHEFRTPLTLMLGSMEDILQKAEGEVLPENRSLAKVAHRNGLRLLKLVNTLLDFSRIEAGRVEPSFEAIDLAAFTTELSSIFEPAAAKAGLRWVVDCPPLPELAYVDREMWEKIVINLLSNAFKFTFSGEIKVTMRQRNGRFDLSVSDTGIGIPEAELPRIFERFHCVRGARSRSHEGTGIGLALVQELTRLHGGEVKVKSTAGCGSTFTVSIKTGSAHLPQERIGAGRVLESTATGAGPFVEEALQWLPDFPDDEGKPVSPGLGSCDAVDSVSIPSSSTDNALPRILLADDNADMRRYVRRLLSEHYDVITVPDGEAALRSTVAQRPDLVISDIMMPNLDGFGLLRELRRNPQTRSIPIILLSARAGEEARVEGIEQRADDYLVKPFSARELLARVKTHLELARVRRDSESQAIADAVAAAEANAKFRAFFEQGIYFAGLMELDGTVIEANRLAYEACGFTKEQVVGKKFWDCGWWNRSPAVIQMVREGSRQAANGEIFRCETEYFIADGSVRHVAMTIVPVKDQANRVLFLAPSGVDITDRKQAEAALRENAERLKIAVDAAELGIYVWNVAEDTVTWENDRIFLMFGRSPSDAPINAAEFGSKVVHPDDAEAFRLAIAKTLATGERFYFQGRSFRKDGTPGWVEFTGQLERDAAGAPLRMLGAVLDITQRKLAEAALEESRAALAFTLESAQVGDWDLDLTTDTSRRSLRHDQCFGYSESIPEWGFAQLIQHIHPEDRSRVEHAFKDSLIQLKPWRFESRVIWPDGSIHWIALHGSIYRTKNGRPTRMLGIVANITERKQTEEAIHRLTTQSEQQRRLYDTILSHTPDLVYVFDLNHRFTYANKALLEMWGRTWEESIGKNCLELGYEPLHAARHDREIEQVITTRKPIRGEVPFIGANGRRIYDYIFAPVISADGEVEAIAGTTRDVTERKLAEENLHDSRERLRAALNGSGAGTFRWNIRTNALDWDENLDRLFGLPPGQTIRSLENFIATVHPDERPEVVKHCQRCAHDGADFDMEFRVIWPDGSVHWVDDKGKIFFDEYGRPEYMAGMCLDITERKRAQQLEASQKQVLQLIAEDAPLSAVFESIVRMIEEQSSKGMYASILMLDDDGVHLRHGAAPNLPEAYNRAIDGVAIGPKVGSCGTAAHFKKPVYVSDIANDPLWAEYAALALSHNLRACWSTPIFSSTGQMFGTFAMYYSEVREPNATDLRLVEVATRIAAIAIERKRGEREKRRLISVIENSSDFIGVSDTNGNPIFANQAAMKLVGMDDPEQVRRSKMTDYFVPDQRRFVEEVVIPTMVREGRWSGELSFQHFKTGAAIPVLYDLFRVDDPKTGQPTNFATVTRDITESKRTEQALRHQTERFAILINNTPLGIYLVDDEFRIRQVNPVALPAFGNIPDLIGQDFDAVIHKLWPPAFADEVVQIFRHTLATGEPYIEPERIEQRLDIGVTEYYEWQIHRIPLPEGRFGVVCYFREISAQVLAREKIRESETRLRFMAESMPQKIFTARLDGTTDYFNQQWEQFTGLTCEQISAGGWLQFVHPEDQEENIRRWNHSIETGEDFQFEHRFRRNDGEYRWHLSRAQAMRNAEGQILMWIGSSTDIDDQKRAEEKLEKTVEQRTAKLRETVSELEAFSYSIAHDMRSPLRSLQGFSDILIEDYGDKIDSAGQNYLRRIGNSAGRMDRLIQDILNYSKVVRAELPLEPVNVERLLRDMLETYPMFLPDRVEVQIQGTIPKMLGNEAALTQCLSNLLGNAAKFVPSGVKPLIQVSAETRDRYVRIMVRDNGIGISPDQHQKIFEIFQRVEKSYEGTGIGLAIVKKSVERMSGKVGLESKPGQGSTFWIELQRA